MSFLLRSYQPAAVASSGIKSEYRPTDAVLSRLNTPEGLIGQDSVLLNSIAEDQVADEDKVEVEDQNDGMEIHSSTNDASPIVQNHIDVSEDEGFITIPKKELPDDWMEAPDIHSFHSLDRGFVFPGEQVHILACLSSCKQDTEIITPFKVAAIMNKNRFGRGIKKENGDAGFKSELFPDSGEKLDHNVDNVTKENIDKQKDASDGEMLLRMEVQRRQTDNLLQKIQNSHFLVRIAELDEPLWEKRIIPITPMDGAETRTTTKNTASISTLIERRNFDASVSGGLARNSLKCCSLSNGDIVVLLQINIGVDFVKDPFLEIYQFEKFQDRNLLSEDHSSFSSLKDPCGDLLKWLLPVDNSTPPLAHPLPPSPAPTSNTSIRSTSNRSNFSSPSSSQLFSFSNFRSYSMSTIPPTEVQHPTATHSIRPDIELDDWDMFPTDKFPKSSERGIENILSFRGVTLEPERFSVQCGLEGIFTPGKRWRKKIEVIQPIEIHSFAADCNTDDLLCVQIKNVAPENVPDIVIYLDSVSIIYEEASKGGPPPSLPIACIEAGDMHSLPNLILRRGEEHSFILKPVTSMGMTAKGHSKKNSQLSHLHEGSSSLISSKSSEVKEDSSASDQFAVLVSCRCNYTESRLFFKQSTSWRPRISRDLMISVASAISSKNLVSDGTVPQLPVQVLTLHASNLSSEDLTMTVHAPASFTTPPTVVSINSCPATPMSPFIGYFDHSGRVRKNGENDPHSVILNENGIPSTDSSCTHLWLHSKVPLGCVPAKSMATIKLELLPLTDGIITLDSLQIHIKERGLTYVPEQSLKINATSSIATRIM